VKVTLMLQAAPAATDGPHVFVWAYSALAVIEVMTSAALPEFVSETVCAGLIVLTICEAKVRLAGDKTTAGATPVPSRLTVCGLKAALSAIVTAADAVPVTVGTNVTLTVQLLPALRAAGQLFV
jgi:hypothetical protein